MTNAFPKLLWIARHVTDSRIKPRYHLLHLGQKGCAIFSSKRIFHLWLDFPFCFLSFFSPVALMLDCKSSSAEQSCPCRVVWRPLPTRLARRNLLFIIIYLLQNLHFLWKWAEICWGNFVLGYWLCPSCSAGVCCPNAPFCFSLLMIMVEM